MLVGNKRLSDRAPVSIDDIVAARARLEARLTLSVDARTADMAAGAAENRSSGNCTRGSSAMMTPAAEIRDRWLARRDELRRRGKTRRNVDSCGHYILKQDAAIIGPARS
jgi:hypothetical protein